MAERIYAIGESGSLVGLDEAPYESEDVLQALIEQHPGVLAGEQMDSGSPRQWVLVSREMGIADDADGGDRWSIDHLLLDQDAIPTLVEVKRASDTRIRREVVGQMLDYAANAVVYWPLERIQVEFESRVADAEEQITELVGSGGIADVEAFWAQVALNLRAGNVRMVFVADRLPTELIRIIEFLNGQMNPADVVGVELKQFVGEGLRILVPRVVGAIASTRERPRRTAREWDEASFFEAMSEQVADPDLEAAARDVYHWACEVSGEIGWGRGAKSGACYVSFSDASGPQQTFSLWSNGSIQIEFGRLANTRAFGSLASRQELQGRLEQIPGVKIDDERIDKYPNLPLSALLDPDARAEFRAVIEWVRSELERADRPELDAVEPS